jgi:hypothetical protein
MHDTTGSRQGDAHCAANAEEPSEQHSPDRCSDGSKLQHQGPNQQRTAELTAKLERMLGHQGAQVRTLLGHKS